MTFLVEAVAVEALASYYQNDALLAPIYPVALFNQLILSHYFCTHTVASVEQLFTFT